MFSNLLNLCLYIYNKRSQLPYFGSPGFMFCVKIWQLTLILLEEMILIVLSYLNHSQFCCPTEITITQFRARKWSKSLLVLLIVGYGKKNKKYTLQSSNVHALQFFIAISLRGCVNAVQIVRETTQHKLPRSYI